MLGNHAGKEGNFSGWRGSASARTLHHGPDELGDAPGYDALREGLICRSSASSRPAAASVRRLVGLDASDGVLAQVHVEELILDGMVIVGTDNP